MRLNYNGETLTDLLEIKIKADQKRIIDAISDDQLIDYVREIQETKVNEYYYLFDYIALREFFLLSIKGEDEYEYKNLKRNKLLEEILKSEFIKEPFLSKCKSLFNNQGLEELVDSFHQRAIQRLKLIDDMNNKIILKQRVFNGDVANFFELKINLTLESIIINNLILESLVKAYQQWKIPLRRIKKMHKLYNENAVLLGELLHFKSDDPLDFFKYLHKNEKYINLKIGDSIDELDVKDQFLYNLEVYKEKNEIFKNYNDEVTSKRSDKQSINKYILLQTSIEELFNKYGEVFGDSEEEWWERFIDIDIPLKKPIKLSKDCREGRNQRILINILGVIDEIIHWHKKEERRVRDFNNYASFRWEVNGYLQKKNQYFDKSSHNPITYELKEMIIKEKK